MASAAQQSNVRERSVVLADAIRRRTRDVPPLDSALHEQVRNGESASPSTFYEHLSALMSDPVFRSFVERYFSTWSDSKATLMLMHLFAFVSDEYTNETGQRLDDAQCLQLVRALMDDVDCRGLVVQGMKRFMDAENESFLKAYRQGMRLIALPRASKSVEEQKNS